MKKVAFIHYMPLEFYPPIVNLLDVLSNGDPIKAKVWSTHNNKNRVPYTNTLFKIDRVPFPSMSENRILRLLKYVLFNLKCFFGLILYRPDTIMYIESYSVWPVYWYLRLFGKHKGLFIHYHEYSSPEWYEENMVLVKHYHKLEKQFLYKKASWISQTNPDRVNLFVKDHPSIEADKLKVLPNYPPKKWMKTAKANTTKSDAIRTVYIGSLSLSSTYIKEYCELVISMEGRLMFDIYAYNLHKDTLDYLSNLKSPYINYFKDGIEYNEIPNVLNAYDVGVILYKGLTLNYKYNAPNKLFEYMACNLRIWYPKQLLGIKPYESEQVISFDFESLNSAAILNSSIFEKNNTFHNKFIAENALKPLMTALFN